MEDITLKFNFIFCNFDLRCYFQCIGLDLILFRFFFDFVQTLNIIIGIKILDSLHVFGIIIVFTYIQSLSETLRFLLPSELMFI